MKVLVTASAHFIMDEDGKLWTPNASLGYQFWSRYLAVYDEVNLLVRVKPCITPPPGWNQATGVGIRAIPLPDYIGPVGFVRNYRHIRQIIRKALVEAEAIQLRLPCAIGTTVWQMLSTQRPYGVEVVADPYDMFAPGSIKHPLRPFFRWWFYQQLRHQCANACAVAYVTAQALQRRYPTKTENFSTHYSSIDLPDAAFVSTSRSYQRSTSLSLITVGTLDQLYKAPDILINSVAICIQQGFDLKLTLVGDGSYRPNLEAKAAKLGLADRVNFCGQLATSEAVRSCLDQADLFVLPSRQEGLPRAMIEAMARGLPCIGSTVGGIPELLPSEDMVPPGEAQTLAGKIQELITNPERMINMSLRNLEKAKEYHSDILRQRRNTFYQQVQNETEVWMRLHPSIKQMHEFTV